MRVADVVLHPLRFAGITVPEFLHWYFFERPMEIVQSYLAYLRAFADIFSFGFLLKTLFCPWKQITGHYPTKGINPTAIAETFILNCLSRTIGLLFRITGIAFGTTLVAVLTVSYATYYLIWLVFPVFFWFATGYLISAVF